MKILYIYKITNKLNGKIYVGKHSSEKIDNTYMGSGVIIKKAIKKYGKENFKKSILEVCEDENLLNIQEKYWIKKTGAFENDYGYNLTKGGEGLLGFIPSAESIKKASESRKQHYIDHPETSKNISEKAKIRVLGKGNPFYGKKLSKEHIEKMRVARVKAISGSKNKSAVKVRCVEKNITFNTAKEAAIFCNLVCSTTILKAAKNQRKTAGGYTWEIIKWSGTGGPSK